MDNKIYDCYRRELIRLHDKNSEYGLRMIAIEYLCQFPGIDPIEMARSLIADGYKVVFDDSSISQKENERKRRQCTKWGSLK